jgi:CHAT domain-containing protein
MGRQSSRYLRNRAFLKKVIIFVAIGLTCIGGLILCSHLSSIRPISSVMAQDPEFEANRLNSLGLAYLAQKDYPKAIAAFRESAALAKANLHPGGKGTQANALNNLGAALYLNQQLSEAEPVFREAMAVMEALRDQQQGNELLAIQFFDNQQSFLYRTLQQVLVEQGKVAEALEIAERGRARILVEQLIRQRSRPTTAGSSTSPAPVRPITVQEIQQIAKTQNLTLVEYSLFPDTSEIFMPGRDKGELQNKPVKLYIWVVQPTGKIQFQAVDLTEPQWRSQTIAERVVAARVGLGVTGRGPSIEIEQLSPEEVAQAARKPLQDLHQLLIEPIAQFLPDPEGHIAFIPQESLFLLPFAALQDLSGKYLVEKYPILTASSIQTLSLTQQPQQNFSSKTRIQPTEALIVGISDQQIIQLAGKPVILDPLPATATEAQSIAQIFKAKALLGEKALKAAVVARMPQAKVIHLATHGLLDDFKGMEIPGAIALFPSGKQANDGLLTADEIADLNLKAEMVVLSACNTGRGSISGDGVIGLSRSFILAGTSSVMVSLWSVPDAPTAELMAEFYRNWQAGGKDKAQALQQAMINIMKIHSHPRQWGAFVLIGDME